MSEKPKTKPTFEVKKTASFSTTGGAVIVIQLSEEKPTGANLIKITKYGRRQQQLVVSKLDAPLLIEKLQEVLK